MFLCVRKIHWYANIMLASFSVSLFPVNHQLSQWITAHFCPIKFNRKVNLETRQRLLKDQPLCCQCCNVWTPKNRKTVHHLPFPTPPLPQGRGSGFPGRRRSRGGGVGGGRGARGRSRLKTQDSLTVSPGVRKRSHTLSWSVDHQWIDLSLCLSVSDYWAIPAEGGGGQLNAQHSGDVFHLWPFHPPTGTSSTWTTAC